MPITDLHIVQFKNHAHLHLRPDAKWNVFTGLNGSGKTNALDAIYMSSVLKSFLKHSMDDCIRVGCDFFRLSITHDDSSEVIIKYPQHGTRTIQWRGKQIKRPGEFIGRYPSLLIQPIDDYKLLEGKSERRAVLDHAISQFDGQYLDALMRYNKIILQRNKMLKDMRSRQVFDKDELSIYDPLMIRLSDIIIKARSAFIQQITPYLIDYYIILSDGREIPDLAFVPDARPEELTVYLDRHQLVDIQAGRTSRGPHLDEVDMRLDGHALKKIGSQGQRKSYLMALKLAVYQILRDKSGQLPMLLLDDLFDKLDLNRVSRLLLLLQGEDFGQIFITEKDGESIERLMYSLGIEMKIIHFHTTSTEEE